MAKVIVSGARGRIGALLLAEAKKQTDIEVVGAIGNPIDPLIGTELLPGVYLQDHLKGPISDAVLIEFSTPEATINHIQQAVIDHLPVIIGTTGFTTAQKQEIKVASGKIPILISHNYGIGMNAFWEILKVATNVLGSDYDVEVVEFHAAAKPDVPSGTGKTIASLIAHERGEDPDQVIKYGRDQNTSFKRSRQEIGVHSLRAGGYRSDHMVIFAGKGERLEFTYREEDSSIIVQGVIWAVRFLSEQKPGLYSMQEVLSFKNSYVDSI